MRVLIAGGGTAGHVAPAVAVAEVLRSAGHAAFFVGTPKGVEAQLVPAAGFELDYVDVAGFDRARPWRLPMVGARALSAMSAVRSILRTRDVDVVLGMGGYVSLPAAAAARRNGIPLVLHEQNAVLGLAHRVSARWATTVATSWPQTVMPEGIRTEVTGLPVGSRIATLQRSAARAEARRALGLRARRKTLLAFGGSLGARTINEAVKGVASAWIHRGDVQILHIMGSAGYSAPISIPGGSKLVYRAYPFIDSMAPAYAAADLALTRAGASTVAELCCVALPSLLVPYPHHRDRQQELHAESLADAGAAVVLNDRDASPAIVARTAAELLDDPGRLAAMARDARSIARPEAAERVADLVLSIARGKEKER